MSKRCPYAVLREDGDLITVVCVCNTLAEAREKADELWLSDDWDFKYYVWQFKAIPRL